MLLIVPQYKLWISSQPLGALSIAAVLRKNGKKITFIDGICEENLFARIDREIGKHKSVGISSNIAQAYSGRQIAEYIRKKYPDKIIIWGGPYASVEYQRLIPSFADAVVVGEGERQAVALANGTPYSEVDGFAYWDKKKNDIIYNPRKEFITDLNSLPYPAWDLIASNCYSEPGLKPSFVIVTERGCPFHCINCTKVIHGDRFRTRSVQHIIGELKMLVEEYGAKEFHIWDDNFTLYPKRTKEICRAIIDAGISKKARFILPNGIRADICDEEMFDLMREANFQVIIIAIESADQEVIDKLQKKLDLNKVRRTVQMAVDKGFRVGLFFMMGLPFEKVSSLKKTAEFAASLPAHHAFFWRVTPFPGTKLYEIYTGNGRKLNTDYIQDYIDYEAPVQRFEHPNISHFQLSLHIRLAYFRFYGNPLRLYRIAKKLIEEKVFINDFYILIKSAVGIFFRGRR